MSGLWSNKITSANPRTFAHSFAFYSCAFGQNKFSFDFDFRDRFWPEFFAPYIQLWCATACGFSLLLINWLWWYLVKYRSLSLTSFLETTWQVQFSLRSFVSAC